MRDILFNPRGASDKGYAIVRIVMGLLLVYHGVEVFNTETMAGYGKWLGELGFPSPVVMGYLGKGSELVCGVCFVLGALTRWASVLLILVMAGIAFGMGHGKIFTEDQHPFLFILLGFIFFFSGPGKWSVDEWQKSKII